VVGEILVLSGMGQAERLLFPVSQAGRHHAEQYPLLIAN
jgi:hypothetical protein